WWECRDRGRPEAFELGKPREVADDLAEAGGRTNDDTADGDALRPVLDRDDGLGDACATSGGDERHRTRDRSQRSIEGQLADERDAAEVGLELAGRDEDGRGHGQVVSGSLF